MVSHTMYSTVSCPMGTPFVILELTEYLCTIFRMPPPVVKPGDWKDDRNGQKVWVPTIGLGEYGGHRSPRSFDPTVAQRIISHSIGAPSRPDFSLNRRSAPSSPAAAMPPSAPRNPRDVWQQLHQTPPERMQQQSFSYGGYHPEPHGYRSSAAYSQPFPLANYGSNQSSTYGNPRQQYSSPQYRSYGRNSEAPPQHQQVVYGRFTYEASGGYSVPNSFLRPLTPYAPPQRGPQGFVQRGNTITGHPPPQRFSDARYGRR